ncbi:hypothetical protein BDV06DRAFT_45312 [Aspergillus oleicola]
MLGPISLEQTHAWSRWEFCFGYTPQFPCRAGVLEIGWGKLIHGLWQGIRPAHFGGATAAAFITSQFFTTNHSHCTQNAHRYRNYRRRPLRQRPYVTRNPYTEFFQQCLTKAEYLPAIQGNSSFSLKAVYSRSQKSAAEFGTAAATDVYYDSPSSDDRSLAYLLARSDIDAVVIALPIPAQPAIIRAALKARKHVLSEKPIAKNTVVAGQLLTEYTPYKEQRLIWGVAENFRSIEPIAYGVEQLKQLGGEVTAFQISVHDLIQDGNPFFATEWRKNPEYPGGFILDGGVHFLAGLREFLSAVGDSITKVVAFSTQIEPHLPPVDTLNGALLLKSGRSGTINLSYGTEFKNDFLIEVVTSNGSVSMTPAGVTVLEKDAGGKWSEKIKAFAFSTGVAAEVEAFGRAIRAKNGNVKQSPEEALLDLRIVELLLKSGEERGVVLAV